MNQTDYQVISSNKNSPTLGSVHTLQMKAFGYTMVSLFAISISILMYDHFKYGTKDPPKWLKDLVSFAMITILILIGMLLIWIWWVHGKLGHGNIAKVVSVFAVILLISSTWWAYYHFKIRKEYEGKAMPKMQKILHNVAMYTSISCIVIIILMMCSQAPLACFLLSQ